MAKILTLTGRSGVGKTSIAELLCREHENVRLVQSYTTRKPRPSDLPGEYAYISEEEFMARSSEFLWATSYHGCHYGTRAESICEVFRNKESVGIMILVPEVIQKLRGFLKYLRKESAHVPVFVRSPSRFVLRERLCHRGDALVALQERAHLSSKWEENARLSRDPIFHFVSNNGPLASAVSAVLELIT